MDDSESDGTPAKRSGFDTKRNLWGLGIATGEGNALVHERGGKPLGLRRNQCLLVETGGGENLLPIHRDHALVRLIDAWRHGLEPPQAPEGVEPYADGTGNRRGRIVLVGKELGRPVGNEIRRRLTVPELEDARLSAPEKLPPLPRRPAGCEVIDVARLARKTERAVPRDFGISEIDENAARVGDEKLR